MPDQAYPTKYDRITIIAVSALGCILQDVLHEGLGHGVTAWLSGAHRLTISTVALQSDIETRWISAAGTLVNLFTAAILWLLLSRAQHYRPVTRYFLVLALAGNLFTATGYFLFSGVANFGDWAAVISGLHPYWMWRLGLIVLGAATYYTSMLLVAAQLRPFQGRDSCSNNLRALCWTPYFTDAVLAGAAGLFNPAGLFYVIASALPSTLGANAGLMSLPGMVCRTSGADETGSNKSASDQSGFGKSAPEELEIPRSLGWIVSAAVACLLFIFVLGRGMTWSR